jgi:CRISPR-associated protein Csx17
MGAAWLEGRCAVVWNSAELSRNLAAVLERRIMDGERAGCDRLPLACRRTSSLAAIATFIAGATDDRRIEELLWGMLLINHYKDYPILKRRAIDAPPLPRTYALLKLLFMPGPHTKQNESVEVRPEMTILPLLRAKRVDDACQIAIRRLRASGFIPQAHKTLHQWHTPDPARLAASLLIPVASRDVEYLKSMVLRPETNNQAVTR